MQLLPRQTMHQHHRHHRHAPQRRFCRPATAAAAAAATLLICTLLLLLAHAAAATASEQHEASGAQEPGPGPGPMPQKGTLDFYTWLFKKNKAPPPGSSAPPGVPPQHGYTPVYETTIVASPYPTVELRARRKMLFAHIMAGVPPQKFDVVIDTGHALTWLLSDFFVDPAAKAYHKLKLSSASLIMTGPMVGYRVDEGTPPEPPEDPPEPPAEAAFLEVRTTATNTPMTMTPADNSNTAATGIAKEREHVFHADTTVAAVAAKEEAGMHRFQQHADRVNGDDDDEEEEAEEPDNSQMHGMLARETFVVGKTLILAGLPFAAAIDGDYLYSQQFYLDGVLGLGMPIDLNPLMAAVPKLLFSTLWEWWIDPIYGSKTGPPGLLPRMVSFFVHNEGGCATFGGHDAHHRRGPITWMPVVHFPTSFSLLLTSIRVGGNETHLCTPFCYAAIHSGQPFITGPTEDVMDLLIKIPVELGCIEFDSLPSLTLVLASPINPALKYTVTFTGEELVKKTVDNGAFQCAPIFSTQPPDFWPMKTWILGLPFMKKLFTVFDVDKNLVGLAKSDPSHYELNKCKSIGAVKRLKGWKPVSGGAMVGRHYPGDVAAGAAAAKRVGLGGGRDEKGTGAVSSGVYGLGSGMSSGIHGDTGGMKMGGSGSGFDLGLNSDNMAKPRTDDPFDIGVDEDKQRFRAMHETAEETQRFASRVRQQMEEDLDDMFSQAHESFSAGEALIGRLAATHKLSAHRLSADDYPSASAQQLRTAAQPPPAALQPW